MRHECLLVDRIEKAACGHVWEVYRCCASSVASMGGAIAVGKVAALVLVAVVSGKPVVCDRQIRYTCFS